LKLETRGNDIYTPTSVTRETDVDTCPEISEGQKFLLPNLKGFTT